MELLGSLLGPLAVMGGGVLLLLAVKRRYGGSWRQPGGGIEVLARAGLGAKQGLALVRVGRRVLLISSGEGGARTLAELSPEDLDTENPASDLRQPRPDGRSAGWRGASSARKVALGVALVSVLVATPGVAAGQQAEWVEPLTPDAGAAEVYQLLPPVSVQVGEGEEGLRLTGTVGTVIVLGLLALTPTLVLLTSSFTRILVVLHLLRQALGTQSTPPGHLLAGLALLLSGVVMTPTLEQIRMSAFDPWMAGEIDEGMMLGRAVEPMRAFMLEHAREEDLRTFLDISRSAAPSTPDDISNTVLMSAFVTSELRAAFEIGFALFLPFVVIDLVVAAILTSMGMFMLPPTMIALPCKLLLFVLMDGWSLLLGALAQSFV